MSPTIVPADRAVGCLLGLALGDALGAPHEGGPFERALWKLIGKTRAREIRWTDDTQMSLDLAEMLLSRGRVDPEALALRFAKSYRWSRGYGPGTAKVLKRVARGMPWQDAVRSVYPQGSYGNGAAMRAPVLGIFYATRPESLPDAARDAAVVTHAHPLGIQGAELIALATAHVLTERPPAEVMAAALETCGDDGFKARLRVARSWLEAEHEATPKDVRRELGNGMTAVESSVTSLYLGLRFQDQSFLRLLDFVIGCGGDVDTIAAMAGALWGSANGAKALPEEHLHRLEARRRIEDLAQVLWEASKRP